MKKERLKKASALLTETRLPISDIAVNCGFSNQGRFAKIFKEEYGSFPLEYRRKSS
ncbi:MAG: helix-turn-helix domain-containing protein [Pseudobutyrivibrio ruminis]|uniref:Helix-turn-helix domain-containing protein n=1 Tax=Pseudobutyrivibrio ruminis TaxID=46206 RepID=A0A927U8J9_9FIRM|nr:helix-turn-helix domain-containing protein [Pseudobutyrivibrio ruminis]